jgi:aryl-alcohol dehydrogenase-like predicted oxidoreductase
MASLVDPTERSIPGIERPVGPLAFGCWRFVGPDVGAAAELLETAVALGLTLVDTADVYGLDWGGAGFGGNEELLGRVLAARPGLRDRIVLATKGGIVPPVPYDSSPTALRAACEASLRRLRADVIDLYQIHRPDPFTHPGAVAEVLGALVAEGKIRAVGVSNHTPTQTAALAAHLPVPIATDQPEYSVAHLDPLRDGTFDACIVMGRVPLAWSPLAGGRVADGIGLRPGLVDVLDELAMREQVTRTAIALAFVLAHPARPVAVVGTQRPERLHDAVRAVGVHLDRADVYRIVQASDGVPLP